MFKPFKWARLLSLLGIVMALSLVLGACGDDATTGPGAADTTGDTTAKEVVKFHDGQWETLWEHNAIAMYITQNGYGYPVEQITGTTGTMKVALPAGDLDVAMEMWRQNQNDWYNENTASGKVVDLGGSGDNLATGAVGQSLETSLQGIYVPTYMIDQNPGLKSVLDLPNFVELFQDPENSSMGVVTNCIIGWQCQKVIRAKWFAYGLNDTVNLIEPGGAGAIDANIIGAMTAGEPVVSYYWEPTKLISQYDMTLLDEPAWTAECQAAIDAAIEEEPYESTIGCAFPASDVHTGVSSAFAARAPEVTAFLGKMFLGALPLADLATWKNDNDKEWDEAAIYYLQNNEAVWTQWVPADVAAKVKEALALES